MDKNEVTPSFLRQPENPDSDLLTQSPAVVQHRCMWVFSSHELGESRMEWTRVKMWVLGREGVRLQSEGSEAPVQDAHCRAGLGEWAALWRTCWTGQGQGREVAHPAHLSLPPQLCAGPSLFQGFGCGQTGSCPQIADILLRGADKSQVKATQTEWAVAISSSKVRFFSPIPSAKKVLALLHPWQRDCSQLLNFEQDTV